ncbi:MAG: PTS lactose/cellobiose transporter subunit IIA [Erysipelotrichaceae bacterium]|nr:PTS lactose/cellobiose transporter subunit IIA [Erysipelotrichaceae bacterium]MDY5252923.1 PTS lactose/cellobiose transporter subunit IIA [Erysipelotrichaceae bacterium]
MENENELVSFNIIANAGDARSLAFGALQAAKLGNYEEASELLKKSDEAANLAHKAQTELLFKEANGEKTNVDVLLVHAQDHLMTSMLAVELIKELIEMYQRNKEEK